MNLQKSDIKLQESACMTLVCIWWCVPARWVRSSNTMVLSQAAFMKVWCCAENDFVNNSYKDIRLGWIDLSFS